MRALFFGTPDIAVPALEALCEVAEVAGVVCQPDRPAGRGLKLAPPPVKVRAAELGLEVMQPVKIRSGAFPEWVEAKQADVALVIAYGRILPRRILEAPRRGCLNLHASILPRYRGAAPINWAIVRGERETGVSLMQMDEGCDTGPVFSIHRLAIGPDETAGELYGRLGVLAAEVVRSDVARAVDGSLVAIAQDHAAATLAPMLQKSDGLAEFARASQEVHDHVRGMTPWPGAHTTARGKHLKLLVTRVGRREGVQGRPGEVLALGDHAEIGCGSGTLLLLRGQLAGKKPLDARRLAQGRALSVGDVLG